MDTTTEPQYEKVVCGQCKQEFATLVEEHAHICPSTGFTPQQPEHYGEELQRVSEAALQRGEARKEAEAQETVPQQLTVESVGTVYTVQAVPPTTVDGVVE
jgi:hypothetical protein